MKRELPFDSLLTATPPALAFSVTGGSGSPLSCQGNVPRPAPLLCSAALCALLCGSGEAAFPVFSGLLCPQSLAR